ncbi:MAG: hypothetical protein VX589_18270 [Myxococcota bacterium]|nr:hypothetical protein [Myxococcota bacterium]
MNTVKHYISTRLGVFSIAMLSSALLVTTASNAVGKEKTARFPAVVKKFSNLNELKQEAFAETFPGTVLSGKGKVFEVSRCGWLDESEAWGSDCFKVTLDSGAPRVALYYGDDDKELISALDKGQRFSFENCVAVGIKDWGFWSTATCDMPTQTKKKKKAKKVAKKKLKKAGKKGKRRARFPRILKRFKKMSKKKKKRFAKKFPGALVSGKGTIHKVSKCKEVNASVKWEDDCYRVVLKKGKRRAYLYYSGQQKKRVKRLEEGASLRFKRCAAVSIGKIKKR